MKIAKPSDSHVLQQEIAKLSLSLHKGLISLSDNPDSGSLATFKATSFGLLFPSVKRVLVASYIAGAKDVDEIPPASTKFLDTLARQTVDQTIGYISQSSANALDITSAAYTKETVSSKARAKLIAEDNLNQAFYTGIRLGWSTNKLAYKGWYVHDSHDKDDICDDNEAIGPIKVDKPFPSGHFEPKAHFGCNCYLVLF